jgi:hypothetical protein
MPQRGRHHTSWHLTHWTPCCPHARRQDEEVGGGAATPAPATEDAAPATDVETPGSAAAGGVASLAAQRSYKLLVSRPYAL